MLKENSFSKTGRLLIENEIANDDFKSKRFYKYLNKIDKLLIENLYNTSNLDEKINIYNIGINVVMHKLTSLLLSSGLYFNADIEPYKPHNYGIYNVITVPNDSKLFFSKEYTNVLNYTANLCENYIFNDTFSYELLSLAKQSFEKIIIDRLKHIHIINLVTKNDDSLINNYTTREISKMDLNFILEAYANDLFVSIEYWIIEQVINNRQVMSRSQLEEIQQQIGVVLEANKELTEELNIMKKKEKQFSPLLDRYRQEALNGTSKQQKMYNEHLAEKNREIKALNKQIQALKDKLTELSSNEVLDDTFNNILEDEIYECDTKLPYVFVMAEWSKDFENNLLEEFDNSVIMHASDKLPINTKLVIFVTSHLKHNMYYKMKSVCTNCGVPYIHCASTNLDIIKNEIAKVLK